MFKGLTKLGKFGVSGIIYFNDRSIAISRKGAGCGLIPHAGAFVQILAIVCRSSNTVAVRLKLQPVKYVGEESDLVYGAFFLANGIVAVRKHILAVRHILQVYIKSMRHFPLAAVELQAKAGVYPEIIRQA